MVMNKANVGIGFLLISMSAVVLQLYLGNFLMLLTACVCFGWGTYMVVSELW